MDDIELELENPWVFAPTAIGTWIVLTVLLEGLFFEWNPFRAVVYGFVGGLVFTVVYLLVRQAGERDSRWPGFSG